MKNLTNVLCRKLGYLDYLSQWPAYFSLIALFTLGASLSLNAQCIDCITTDVENPYEVFIDSTCNVTIKASDLQTDLAACEDLNIRVEDLQGFLVEQGVNEITMEAGFYTDSTLVVIMESPDDISICSAFISLKDTIAPVIEVDDMELFCGVDTCADKLGYPVVIDNCGMIASLSYRDSIIEEGCVGTYSLRFVRIWTALDRVGNTKMAEQNIDLKRADLDDVVFPADVKLSCEEAEVSPENLGWPTVEGDRLDQGVFCNFTVTFEDSETDICSGIGYEIERSWTVKDECSGTSRTFLQSIKVSDDVKPEMQCPQEIVVETDGGKCYATVNLPQPIVYDNCDSEVMLAATTTYGGMGFEEHNLVPKGLHIVHYSAIDKCGNVSKCSVRMIVEDNEQPTAVADEYTVVAIPNGGLARVRANTFDSGSHDNCSGDIYFKARRMDEGSCDWANGDDSGEPGQQEWFDDYLYFCCEDVNQSIVVIMRVYDVDPGDGPIDPDREGPGGDLQGHYTDAMIIVEIQDKIPPRVEDLPDYVIDCTDDIENLARFGSPEIYDICGYALDSTVNYELNDCGTGYIERIFTATD
ncbi:MAG: HYR domain-containing protein, partial [Bacteroidota bacterium]